MIDIDYSFRVKSADITRTAPINLQFDEVFKGKHSLIHFGQYCYNRAPFKQPEINYKGNPSGATRNRGARFNKEARPASNIQLVFINPEF